MNKRKGMSLIVLVITILVMIILAGVVIVSLSENNPIKQANTATEKTNYATYASELELQHVKMLAKADGYDKKSITTEDPDEIKEYINSITRKDAKKYAIVRGELRLKSDIEAGKPLLLEGMTPIKWNGNTEVATTEDDADWYNYDKQKWPNAKTEDGSYFVWIPRYEYKMNYVDPNNVAYGATIDINIISLLQNKPTEGFKIHPAFTDGTKNSFKNGEWDKELSGVWVSKYEMSMEKLVGSNWGTTVTSTSEIGNVPTSSTVRMVSKPGVTAWTRAYIGTLYTNAYNYDRAKESHMMKNSEWGAVAYFTHSKYGRNNVEVSQNTNASYISANGDPHANVDMSSTKNITGIYDLSGCGEEYTAAYLLNTDPYLEQNASSFTKDRMSTKYVTTYPVAEIDGREDNYNELVKLYNQGLRYGDAIVETSLIFWDANKYFATDDPFMVRGQNSANMDPGIFAFDDSAGKRYSYTATRVVLGGN